MRTQTVRATAADQSGICVQGNVPVTLKGIGIVTSGPTSSSDRSSFYGLNAGLLAMSGAQVNMGSGSVVTAGSGANAVFAYGSESQVTISDTVLRTSGQYAHGVMTAGGGSVTATNLTASTLGENSAVIATDRGGGSIHVQGGRYGTAGVDSPGVYSTGAIQIRDASITATGAEAAVIEGSNRIEVTDSDLQGARKSGVMLYQSFSGDAQGQDGRFDMIGGQLSAAAGPLFYVTNASGTVTLRGVQTRAASGVLLRAAADHWGRTGQNGGRATLTGSEQALQGDVTADALSTAALTLKDHSVWTGAFNTSGTAKEADLTLDSSSIWKVTAASHLTALNGAVIQGNEIVNIQGSFTRPPAKVGR